MVTYQFFVEYTHWCLEINLMISRQTLNVRSHLVICPGFTIADQRSCQV